MGGRRGAGEAGKWSGGSLETSIEPSFNLGDDGEMRRKSMWLGGP